MAVHRTSKAKSKVSIIINVNKLIVLECVSLRVLILICGKISDLMVRFKRNYRQFFIVAKLIIHPFRTNAKP